MFVHIHRYQGMVETLEYDKDIYLIDYLLIKTCRRINGTYPYQNLSVFLFICSKVKPWCQNCCIINVTSQVTFILCGQCTEGLCTDHVG